MTSSGGTGGGGEGGFGGGRSGPEANQALSYHYAKHGGPKRGHDGSNLMAMLGALILVGVIGYLILGAVNPFKTESEPAIGFTPAVGSCRAQDAVATYVSPSFTIQDSAFESYEIRLDVTVNGNSIGFDTLVVDSAGPIDLTLSAAYLSEIDPACRISITGQE